MIHSGEVRAVRRRRRLRSLAISLVVLAEALALALGVAWYWDFVPQRQLDIYGIAAGLLTGLPLGAAWLVWRMRAREEKMLLRHKERLRQSWHSLTTYHGPRRALVTSKQRN
jgi:hypothetical protein